MFTDKVVLDLKAGRGGNGIVAWRREKYLPKGGPYGGDGGRGGSIIFQSSEHSPSLDDYRYKRVIKGENGIPGGPNNRRGRNGKNLVCKVPVGTLIKDAETGEILFDFTHKDDKWVACQGGVGGFGNSHFKSSINRAPTKCTHGRPGGERKVELELKLIADVGLVGFPNAGKSTLVSRLAGVQLKIGAYPFTTLRPNLGYYIDRESRILLADIPGIIEGAHENKGLGHQFLRHIERNQVLLFVIDMTGIDGRDPLEDFEVLVHEIKMYKPDLLEKGLVVALNKCDVEESLEHLPRFHKKYPDVEALEISAETGEGASDLITCLKRRLADTPLPQPVA